LVLWTHEHFTIVLMAYLWQLGSRRALSARPLYFPIGEKWCEPTCQGV